MKDELRKGKGRHKNELADRHEEMVALYKQGKSVKEISHLMGYKSSSTVHHYLAQCGFLNIQLEFGICKTCGHLFIRNKKQVDPNNIINVVYCSRACNNAVTRKINNVKRRSIMEFDINDDISVSKLYRRDNGICYLCGEKCDYSDYRKNERGIKICGERYPSIDHIVPLMRGGTHTWANVRLAHRGCNSRKSINEQTGGRSKKHERVKMEK